VAEVAVEIVVKEDAGDVIVLLGKLTGELSNEEVEVNDDEPYGNDSEGADGYGYGKDVRGPPQLVQPVSDGHWLNPPPGP
jgi:hypothetical protein